MTHNEEAVKGLRKMVFDVSPADLGLNRQQFGYDVWGLVMETGLNMGYFTLVVLAEGTTSLYFSSGGGIIGGGQHQSVRNASSQYLQGAQQALTEAVECRQQPPPDAGKVNFYFLTFDGTRLYSAAEEDLARGRAELSPLFFSAHKVITELRKIDQSV